MVVGIIAEYNPFHNGHRYQIEQIRKKIKDATIVIAMSGSFTQRGEPAILDKFTRAKLAINGGCDLVLELPFVHAVRSAQDFARGGINLFKKIGVVDFLAFGAEINDLNLLKNIADIIDTDDFGFMLRNELCTGISYANAIGKTLSKITGVDKKTLKSSNLILAIEYLRAIKSTNIQPLLIPRILAEHRDDNLHYFISSATAIRKAVYSKNPQWDKIAKNVDESTLTALKFIDLPNIEYLFRPLVMKIIGSNTRELKEIYGMNEGLENKLIHVAYSAKDINDFINSMISQRYTRNTIQRLLLYLIIGLKKEYVSKFNDYDYARILAFNQRGRELLKKIKRLSEMPIITKITQHINSRAIYKYNHKFNSYHEKLMFDVISTNIASILCCRVQLGKDFTTSPIYIN